jgi:hypothetical protein
MQVDGPAISRQDIIRKRGTERVGLKPEGEHDVGHASSR